MKYAFAGRLFAAIGLVGLLYAPSAWAQSSAAECRTNPYLSRAKDQYDRLEFDRAAGTLQRAIEHSRNCRWELAEIFRLKGFVEAIDADREQCQRAFEILLALDPEYRLPSDVPPKIKTCFEDARSVPESRRRLAIEHEAPTDVQPNAPVSLPVKVTDSLRLVDRVQVYFRREGVRIYTLVSARADDQVSLVIPALSVPPDEKGYRMEYFIRAVDRWDGTLDEDGGPQRPLTFTVAPADTGAGNVASSWWFWTLLALGAAAAGSAVVLASQSGGDTIGLTFKDGGVGGAQ